MKLKISILLYMILISFTLIQAITIKDVSSSPKEVMPGEIVTVSIEIENIFENSIKNINVKLNLEEVPFAPYQSSSEKFLDKLYDGDEEIFKFKLIVLPETKSGIYKIPVEISYGENGTKDELISLIVNSKPELKTSLEDSVVLIKGKENEISIKIVNSGLGDAKFVFLKANDISGIKFLTEREQYIGDIDSDDFDIIKYNVYIEMDASKIISLPIILKYKDSTNKEYTETSIITLKTYSLKEAQELGLMEKPNYTLYLIIGLLIIGYITYRFLRKRKLKKKREA